MTPQQLDLWSSIPLLRMSECDPSSNEAGLCLAPLNLMLETTQDIKFYVAVFLRTVLCGGGGGCMYVYTCTCVCSCMRVGKCDTALSVDVREQPRVTILSCFV